MVKTVIIYNFFVYYQVSTQKRYLIQTKLKKRELSKTSTTKKLHRITYNQVKISK